MQTKAKIKITDEDFKKMAEEWGVAVQEAKQKVEELLKKQK